jgi:hypothetical protein
MQALRETPLGILLSTALQKTQKALTKISRLSHFSKDGKDGGVKSHCSMQKFQERNSISIST